MPSLDLSLSGMLVQTTGPVRVVLVLLLLCSVACWAIIFEKIARLARLRGQARAFEKIVRGPGTAFPPGPLAPGLAAVLVQAATVEWHRRPCDETTAARRERVERVLRETMTTELMPVEARLALLATIGSAAPFVGLFGTVWGIMHAFGGLAEANQTSLAAVASGIAEALSTTAVGLAAAIPASVAYNTFAAALSTLARRLGLAIAALARQTAEVRVGERA